MRERPAICRQAFTLIELIAVLVILGLLSIIASLSLGGVMDRYQLTRAAETLQSFDAKARREAARSRETLEGVISNGQHTLVIREAADQNSTQWIRYQLPRTVTITETRVSRKVISGRELTIPFRHGGCSPTYAVQLRRGRMSRWIVVLGISGQVIPVDGEEQVDALLSL